MGPYSTALLILPAVENGWDVLLTVILVGRTLAVLCQHFPIQSFAPRHFQCCGKSESYYCDFTLVVDLLKPDRPNEMGWVHYYDCGMYILRVGTSEDQSTGRARSEVGKEKQRLMGGSGELHLRRFFGDPLSLA
jgi:hypothetical protein